MCHLYSVSSERASGHDERQHSRLADLGLIDHSDRLGLRLSRAVCAPLPRQSSQLVRRLQGTVRVAADRPRRRVQGQLSYTHYDAVLFASPLPSTHGVIRKTGSTLPTRVLRCRQRRTDQHAKIWSCGFWDTWRGRHKYTCTLQPYRTGENKLFRTNEQLTIIAAEHAPFLTKVF